MTYKIRRKYHYKGYVFLLTALPGNAYWSAHKYEGDQNVSIYEMIKLFQSEHDKQIEGLVKKSLEEEPPEFTDITNIEDRTKIN